MDAWNSRNQRVGQEPCSDRDARSSGRLRSDSGGDLPAVGLPVTVAGGAFAMTVATVASAQATVPKPKEDPSGAPFTSAAAAILCTAVVVFAVSMKAKRGHTD
ncbi:MAG: hypothetical protein AAF235_05915 [Planctomycetota bacterium]